MKHARWIAALHLTLFATSVVFAQGGGTGVTPAPSPGGGGNTPTPNAPAPTTPGTPSPTPSAPPVPSPPTGPSTPGAPGLPNPNSPGVVSPLPPGMPGEPARPRSPRGNGVTSDDPGSWRVWWTLNHDRFIDVAAHAPIATSDGSSTAVLDARIQAHERLAPILIKVIQQEKNEILLGRALVALAKLGENPRLPNSRDVYKVLLPLISNDKRQVAESAAVALGILGHEDAVMALSQVATLTARDASGKVYDDRVRAFAVYGLGIVARDTRREDVRRVAASRLCAIFAAEKGALVDVKIACLQALSMIPLAADTQTNAAAGGETEVPSASRSAEIEWVLRVLDSSNEQPWVRAQAATTSARLCVDQPESSKLRARVADRLMERLSLDANESLEVRQSAALGLGLIGDSDADAGDVQIRETLTRSALSDADQATRYYALMALAQAASQPGGPAKDADRLDSAAAVRTLLLKRATSGIETDRAWTAMSLGVFEYRLRQAGGQVSPESSKLLLSLLEDSRSPEVSGAVCLALGLSGITEAKADLLDQLKRADPTVRGFAALALGLLGIREAVPGLEKVLDKAEGSPELYVPVSEGLALLEAPVSDRLVKALVSGLSLEAQLAVCVALGRTGGSRCVQPLSDMVGDSTGTAWVRAVAAEALGSIGDHGATRWNARYAFDLNFLALPLTETAPTIDGVLDLE